MSKWFSIAVIGAALSGCGADGPQNAGSQNDSGNSVSVASPSTAPNLTSAQLASVCKAAIAETFAQPLKIMKIMSNEGGIVRIRYNRPSDGKRWTNDCRVEGERIIWRTVGAFKGDGPGVWRTRPEDEVTTFRIDGGNVTIITKYPDNAPISSTYKMV